MSKSFNRMLDEPIVIMEETYRSPYEDSPMIIPRYDSPDQNPIGSLY